MPNIGPLEIAIVLVIALVIFGPKRLPELGRSAGKGFREFKSSITGGGDEGDGGEGRIGNSDDGRELSEGTVATANRS